MNDMESNVHLSGMPTRSPILVGAVGGSGTRVVARLLAQAGFFIGADRRVSEDSEPIQDFYNVWLRRYIECDGNLQEEEKERAARDFQQAIEDHRQGIGGPDTPWAVKVPRSLLMLPYWHDAFPGAHFIHVVRNGLDMAYSNDGNQLRMFGDLLLTDVEQELPRPLRAMAYWNSANLRAAQRGEVLFRERYHVLRFEDLCLRPAETILALTSFTGGDVDVAKASTEVNVPSTIERWRDHPASETLELLKLGRPALEHFGYDTPVLQNSTTPSTRIGETGETRRSLSSVCVGFARSIINFLRREADN